ncbi:MAG: PilZ domain-containing protein [Sedimentisphaerales bacterium]|nr:PilZ domain-containing protein [Sedimentisphaerales bacterium]
MIWVPIWPVGRRYLAHVWNKGGTMNDVMTPRGVEPRKILQIVIHNKIPAIMSYCSREKWHVAKVLLTDLDGDRFSVESMAQKKLLRPINIQVCQPVGLSFKYEYGKFVFDTTVEDLKPSEGQQAYQERGGTIVLAVPDKIEVIQRRNYFRVNVPKSLHVKVLMWPRNGKSKENQRAQDTTNSMHQCCQGRLVDISAGGAQVVVPHEALTTGAKLKKGQFIGMRFTPMPYETPLILCAQIRNILPTADGKDSSLGVQIVGLEASAEGHETLNRLIGIVEQYYQTNQQVQKKDELQPVPSAV